MLVELAIRQFAIIKELRINFKNGLNILTGETGAGKSIIIDAIQLIIGGRGSVDFIRNQAEKAEIEALFDLPDQHPVFQILSSLGIELPQDGMLLIRRELLQNGKSICRINGQLVTLGMLKEVGQWLIQLHSQHQNQSLFFQDKQLALLDAYGELSLDKTKKEFRHLFDQYDTLRKEEKLLLENEKELVQRYDLLKYQLNEIITAELQPGEDQELIQKRDQIRYSEKIVKGIGHSYKILSKENGVIDLLSHTLSILDQITQYDTKIKEYYNQLMNSYYQIDDISAQLNQMLYQMDFEPNQLNQIEERLSVIHHLRRKYGESVDAILEYAASIEDEIDVIENRDQHLQHIQQKLKDITHDLILEATELSNQRKKLAKELSQKIEYELRDLEMKNAIFNIDIYYKEDTDGIDINGKKLHINHLGIDKVNFLIAPNPGEPLKAIQKIASGGELSRIMLAIQTILANNDEVETIIYDEIDAGVSGRAAQAIAEKLALVAKNKQIFVITHLPQVASMADHHYLIRKHIKDQTTTTEVTVLNHQQKVDEISRMLSGVEMTELTKKHATEMLEKASSFKKTKIN
ncbi:DNA repair protein RecN [Tepidibacillus sp. HK-1]|uniref:DNA repair protein RecN n=1 Tax=Tepidibacillus sp. HK-1 TaxID=1883407 RepID=UPI000853DE16|nr:DNA repair protein RecN [Tepidibacillus sp. HK-1]GBF11048.1 DNA repair protein RecN [Tepidibacillus sp. HK-1]